MSSLLGEWVATRGGAITLMEKPQTSDAPADWDVLIFPADRLGDLVDAGALAKIPNETVMPPRPKEPDEADGESSPSAEEAVREDTFRYMDIAPAYRDQVTRYGSDRMALPYGGSALVLVYRRDAFERGANRDAARAKGLGDLKPPATWEQLDALAGFFQGRDWDGDGRPDHGISLVLGPDAEGLGDATFLARAASLGQHPDHYSFLFDADTMTPRIATAPFVEGLRGLLALKASGPPGLERFDAGAVRESFRAGRVAMLIDRAEGAAGWSHGKPVGVAPLPGSDRVFEPARKSWVSPPRRNAPSYLPRGGGWLIGVRAGLAGTPRDAAIDFAKYLADPENSNRIRAARAFPMLPYRAGAMGQGLPDPTAAPDVDSRSWSDAVSRTLLAERVIPGLRIPGARGYLDDLARGRAAALAGQPPEKALEQVAESWSRRTRTRGPKRQQWHYRQSLNLRAPTLQPPERGT
jgi:multiple sugar transport system substrate-binding protein